MRKSTSKASVEADTLRTVLDHTLDEAEYEVVWKAVCRAGLGWMCVNCEDHHFMDETTECCRRDYLGHCVDCDGEGLTGCFGCSGSGEGASDGSRCGLCYGEGVLECDTCTKEKEYDG